MPIVDHLILLAVSLTANILSAMAGGGAGLLQLPALIFLGLPFSVALATHKIATVALGAGASVKHAQKGNIDWRFTFLMMLSGIPGVIIGANVVLRIPENIATLLLGILTIGLGGYSAMKPKLGDVPDAKNRDLKGLLIGCLVLFALGIFNGSLSSGTGLFVTMWLISWFGLDYKHATASTMALVGIFWNATGAVSLASQVAVAWQWLPMLLLGSIIGGYYGAHLAIKHGNPLIKKVFELVTVLAGLTLIVSSLDSL